MSTNQERRVNMEADKRLKWDELADEYDKKHGGRPARTLSMHVVFEWAEKRTDLFKMDAEGYVYRVESGE